MKKNSSDATVRKFVTKIAKQIHRSVTAAVKWRFVIVYISLHAPRRLLLLLFDFCSDFGLLANHRWSVAVPFDHFHLLLLSATLFTFLLFSFTFLLFSFFYFLFVIRVRCCCCCCYDYPTYIVDAPRRCTWLRCFVLCIFCFYCFIFIFSIFHQITVVESGGLHENIFARRGPKIAVPCCEFWQVLLLRLHL